LFVRRVVSTRATTTKLIALIAATAISVMAAFCLLTYVSQTLLSMS